MSAPITIEEIEAARTPAGGWTKDQLAQWGVTWPPPKGWRKRLIAGGAVSASPFTPEQEARLREIVREEIDAEAIRRAGFDDLEAYARSVLHARLHGKPSAEEAIEALRTAKSKEAPRA